MRRRSLAGALGAVAVFALVAGLSVPATAIHGGDTEVTVGSDDTVFSQNKQNEQRSRSTPRTPTVVAAGSNDNIDMEACNAGPPTDCPFTLDVGVRAFTSRSTAVTRGSSQPIRDSRLGTASATLIPQ